MRARFHWWKKQMNITIKSSGEYRNYEKGEADGRILIQLVSDAQLQIEYQTGSCDGSWQFSNPTEYAR